MLSVLEGGSLRLSCTSIGAPTPAIVWEMNSQPAQFNVSETITMPQAELVGAPGGGLSPSVMMGNITSEIFIVNAQCSADSGNYTCIGSNDGFKSNSSARIRVQVLGNCHLIHYMHAYYVYIDNYYLHYSFVLYIAGCTPAIDSEVTTETEEGFQTAAPVTREIIAWALLSLVTLVLIGQTFAIVSCNLRYLKRKEKSSKAQNAPLDPDGKPSYI